ncbi:MAG: hypothetical protein IJT73_09810 [Selenomonadaceae bacterium]|nr:hypothetical protein [Selenomonadaceae bacterium]
MSESDESNRIIITGLDSDLAVNPATGLFEGIEIDTVNKKINVAASVLGAEDITLWTTGEYSDYEFSLGVDVTTYSVTTPEIWQLGNGSVHYNSGSASAGYSIVGGNRIVSLPAVSETSFSISGLPKNFPSVEQITVDSASSEVKLATSAFSKQDSLAFNFSSADYNFALSDDVLKGDYGAAIFAYGSDSTDCTLKSTADCKYSEITGTSESNLISLGSIGMHCTISGGAGSNTIYGNGCSHTYTSVGNDKVFGFSSDDYLVTNGSVKLFEMYGGKNVAFNTELLDGVNPEDFINVVDGDSTYFARVLPRLIGTSGQDILTNGEDNITIYVFEGNDEITNSGSNVLIYAGTGDDSVINSGANVLIYGDEGADKISLLAGSSGTIYGSGGGKAISVSADAGNHVFQWSNTATDSAFRVDGFKAADSIQILSDGFLANMTNPPLDSTSDYLQLQIGDAIVSLSRADFSTGDTINVIDKNGSPVQPAVVYNVVLGDTISNEIVNSESGVYIVALGGRDTISNSGDSVTIDGGPGTDSIFNTGNDVLILGGPDADTIHTSSTGIVTIYGGTGSDSIKNSGSGAVVYQFGTSENVNNIEGFNSDKDLFYFSSLANSNTSLSAVSINVDASRASVVATGSTIYANGAAGTFSNGFRFVYKDHTDTPTTVSPYVEIVESGTSFTQLASDPVKRIYGQGNNTISTANDNVSIYASSGDNSIVATGDSATVMSSSGNDTVTIGGSGGTVNSGQGNDVIVLTGNATNNTIYAGKGADSIVSNGKGNIFYYAGNIAESSIPTGQSVDTISGFDKDKDHILVRSTATSVTSAVVGSDVDITLQSGSYLTYIRLVGKATAGTLKFYLGTATAANERTQNVGTTSRGNDGWAAIGAQT